MIVRISNGFMVCTPQNIEEVAYCLARAEVHEPIQRAEVVPVKRGRGRPRKESPCPVFGCTKIVKNGAWGIKTHLSASHRDIPKAERSMLAGFRGKKTTKASESAKRGWETRKKRAMEGLSIAGIEVKKVETV